MLFLATFQTLFFVEFVSYHFPPQCFTMSNSRFGVFWLLNSCWYLHKVQYQAISRSSFRSFRMVVFDQLQSSNTNQDSPLRSSQVVLVESFMPSFTGVLSTRFVLGSGCLDLTSIWLIEWFKQNKVIGIVCNLWYALSNDFEVFFSCYVI